MNTQKIMQDLQEAKTLLQDHVIHGQSPDFPSYRFIVGQIQGLNRAISIFQERLKGEQTNEHE